jgi:hypothetical protein
LIGLLDGRPRSEIFWKQAAKLESFLLAFFSIETLSENMKQALGVTKSTCPLKTGPV